MEVSFENYWLSLWKVEAKYKPAGWELYSQTPLHPVFDTPLLPRDREALEKYMAEIHTYKLEDFLSDSYAYTEIDFQSEWDRVRAWLLASVENALKIEKTEALEPLKAYLNIELLARYLQPALVGLPTKGTMPPKGEATWKLIAGTIWEYAETFGFKKGEIAPFFRNCKSLYNKDLTNSYKNYAKEELKSI